MQDCTDTNVRSLLRPAFTLLEVLIVLSLLVLLAAMAWPLMQSQITASELPESASHIRDALYMTRSSAMLEHRRHRIRFAPREQHPFVEIEIDPISRPGEWISVAYPWTREPFLLADVQVTAIHPGRPVWLKPYSETEDTIGSGREKTARDEMNLNIGVTAGAQIGSIAIATGADDAERDELRPPIVFETDGSTGWATIVLSRVEPGGEVVEEEPQKWVILDGRTGLASVRDPLTDEEISNPDVFVRREKLDYPDAVAPEDLTLSITMDEQGNILPPDELGQGALSGDPFMPAGGDGMKPDPNLASGQSGQPQTLTESPPAEAGTDVDPAQKLEEELANSDLTEEEKEKIRKNFQGGGV